MSASEPEKITSIDAEYLSGKRFPYQEDMSLVEDVDLLAATPGEDINWLEDITLLEEDGVPAVFDRYSNSFLKIYFDIPAGREDEIARKVLIKHLAVRQLVRDRAQGAAREVRAAGARARGSRAPRRSAPTGSRRCSRAGRRRPVTSGRRRLAVTLTQLAAFVCVVRRGSVTAAAEELFVTQPSVSAAVAALEREVGAKLLERDGRGLRPTGAGAAFAPYAAHVLGLLEQGERRGARGGRGRPRDAAHQRGHVGRRPRRAAADPRVPRRAPGARHRPAHRQPLARSSRGCSTTAPTSRSPAACRTTSGSSARRSRSTRSCS